ncbi:MAG: oligosaccharide flippase family protein [Ghiorsea sp.]
MSELTQKLFKGSLAIGIAQLVANASAFLLPWAIARGMGESDYGLYAAAYSLAVSLAAIADTGVRVTLIREVSRSPELWKSLVKYALIISIVLASLVALVFAATVFIQDDSSNAIQLRFWLFGYALLWTAMRISLGAAVGHQKLVASSVWGSLERLGGAVLVVVTAFSPSASLIFIAQELLLWEMFVLVALWWWLLKQGWETSDNHSSISLKGFAKAAIPFAFAAVASGLLGRLDLVILGFQRKPEEIAMYAAGQTLSLTLVFVGVAIAGALFPMMSSLGKEKNIEAARGLIEPIVAILALIMLLGGTFISAGAEIWMSWIYGDAFLDGGKWLILYAMMSPIYALGAIVGSVVAAWGWQPQAARWSVGVFFVAVPLYWLSSQWFGMIGIVFCVMLTQFVLTFRAWSWMVRDGLVSDNIWFLKLIALQFFLGLGIFLTPNNWDWIYVPLALVGVIVLGICRIFWLKKVRKLLFLRV